MDGYSYIVPTEADIPYEYEATIDAFHRWNYGAVGGMKAVIAGRYTVSLQYYESIKKVQKQCNLHNYGYQLSVGYQFLTQKLKSIKLHIPCVGYVQLL